MNTLLDKIKNDTFSGIFELAGKAWVPVTLATVVYVILSSLIVSPLLLSNLGLSVERIEALQNMSADPIGMQREIQHIQELVMSNLTGTVIVTFIIAVIVLTLVSCWVYYVAFLAMNDVMKGNKPNMGEILSNSFNGKIFSLFIANWIYLILFMVLYLGVVMIIGLLGSLSPILGALLGLSGMVFMFAYMLRFMLVMPIVALENISVMDAFKQSLETIPMRKGLKYFLIGILAGLVLMIMMMVVGFIFGLLSTIPVLGTILSLAGNVVISGLSITLFSALMMALYYKYRSTDSNDEIEDHLIYNN